MVIKKAIIPVLLILLAAPLMLYPQTEDKEKTDSAGGFLRENDTGQSEDISPRVKQDPRNDTIYFFDGKKMYVNVMKITFDSVIYREPGTNELLTLDKDIINKIKYNWGRLEILNEKPKKIRKHYDWRKVDILQDEQEASGLTRLEEITAKAKGSGRGYETPKSLENKATVILKKKAANINAQYVLITNKAITAAFGESPSATLTGIAYTDKKQDKADKGQ